MSLIIALLVTVTMAGVDYCHAQYSLSMAHRDEHNKPAPKAVSASAWSVGQWSCATICLVVVVKLSLWYLPFEAVGLIIGTQLGARRVKGL